MKQRNGMIDWLRLVFTFYVIIAHMKSVFGIAYPYPQNGWYAVEFFFVLSGFLMASSCATLASSQADLSDVGGTFQIFCKKVSGLYPTWITSFLCFLILNMVREQMPLSSLPGVLAESIPSLLMLSSLGLPSRIIIPYSWYVSTLLLVMMILLPLLRWNQKKFTYYVAPLLSLFCFCWMWHKYHHILPLDQDWLGVTSGKTVRGLADVSVGCMSYELCRVLRAKYSRRLNRLGIALVSILGMLCIGVPLYWMTFKLIHERTVFGVMLFGIGIAVLFSDLSYLRLPLPSRFSVGEYSYAVYLGQGIPQMLLASYYDTVSLRQFAVVYMLMAAISGLIIFFLTKLLRYGYSHLLKALQRWLILEPTEK